MVPDIEFPLLDGHLEDEPAVVGAIDTPGAAVAPAEYRAVNEVAPLLDALRKRHADRTSDDPEFVYLHNRQQRIEEVRSRETLSLREDTRQAQKEADDAWLLATENARLGYAAKRQRLRWMSWRTAARRRRWSTRTSRTTR